MAAPGVSHWGYPQPTAKGAASRTATCLLATYRPGVSSANLLCVTARDSDRDVWRPSSRGLFESSIYPVEHSAGALKVGRTDLGARRVGPRMPSRLDRARGAPRTRRDAHEPGAPMTGIVVEQRVLLHERVGDALHALSRGPEGTANLQQS
jgi:hypothetical protein